MDTPDARPETEMSDFDSVVRRYWPKVFRFVLASIRDRDAAETPATAFFAHTRDATGFEAMRAQHLAHADCDGTSRDLREAADSILAACEGHGGGLRVVE